MKKRWLNVLLVIVIFLGIILRIYRLGKQNFWIDEVLVIEKSITLPSFKETLSWAINWMGPPFYNFLIHFWIKLFGHSEFSIRFLSVSFGAFTLLLIYKVGKKLFNEEVGLLSAYIMAISPLHIVYSQEGKMYTLLPFLGLLSIYFLYRALIKNKNHNWTIYFISTVLLIYTHNWGLFLVISENIFFLLLYLKGNKYKFNIKKYFIIQLLIVLFYLPWTYILFRQFIALKTFVCIRWVGFRHIPATFACFSGKVLRIADNWLEVDSPFCAFGTGIYSLLFCMGLFWKNEEAKKREILLLISYIFPTLIIPFLISLKAPIYDFSKHTIIVLPAFCLISGYGLSKIRNIPWKTLIILGILVSSFPIMYKYYFLWTKSEDKLIVRYVEQNSQKNDIIVIVPGWIKDMFQYYYKGNLKIVEVNKFLPEEVDKIIRVKEDLRKERVIILYEDFPQHPEVKFLKEQLEKKLSKKLSEVQFGNKRVIIFHADK